MDYNITYRQKDKGWQYIISYNELNDLLNKIINRKYYIISLLASKCGLRIGEILGLTWYDIDDKKCLININKQ